MNKMDHVELRPCPFCGGACCVCPLDLEETEWMAHCMDCDCQIMHDNTLHIFRNEKIAVNAWNVRFVEKTYKEV